MLSDTGTNEIGLPSEELSDNDIDKVLFVANMKISLDAKIRLLNDYCWDICVTKPRTKLDKSNETCLANCANRFLDVSKFIIERYIRSIQKMGNNM